MTGSFVLDALLIPVAIIAGPVIGMFIGNKIADRAGWPKVDLLRGLNRIAR